MTGTRRLLDSPPAVVVGLDNITGLQTARRLADHGVPVIAVTRRPRHFCSLTNSCQRKVAADTESIALIQALKALALDLDHRAVLYPCSDISVRLISENRQQLSGDFHVVLPEPGLVGTLMDKAGFFECAQKHGLNVPRTLLLQCGDDVDRATQELTFPLVVKPTLKSPEWNARSPSKAYLACNGRELLDIYERCQAWAGSLMAQEWIPGPESDLYSCNVYFNRSSEALATFTARKLRQWPPELGSSSSGEECRNDTVREETLRFFSRLSFVGLGYLEMKRDERTGSYVAIEANVGRPTGRSAIAEAGGVALLYTMYCDALGVELPSARKQKYGGVKWVYLRRDLQAGWFHWRRGQLGLLAWLKSLSGPRAFAVLSWRDPMPFLGDLGRAPLQILSKYKKGSR